MMFDLARLEAARLVNSIEHHASIGSTSDRAIELAAQGDTALPLLVVAEEQTAGRGRGTNRWLSGAGALTFSAALEAPAKHLPQARWPQVAFVAGLAVCRALLEAAPRADLRVKWPNDVYLGQGKVGGILSESVPGWRERLVVGIGVNVNNAFRVQRSAIGGEQAAAGTRGGPIAMIDADGVGRDLTGILLAILDQFSLAWEQLLAGDDEPLLAAYRERCFLTGKTVTLADASGRQTIGVCQGIDPAGRLVLLTAAGPQPMASGSVVHWDD